MSFCALDLSCVSKMNRGCGTTQRWVNYDRFVLQMVPLSHQAPKQSIIWFGDLGWAIPSPSWPVTSSPLLASSLESPYPSTPWSSVTLVLTPLSPVSSPVYALLVTWCARSMVIGVSLLLFSMVLISPLLLNSFVCWLLLFKRMCSYHGNSVSQNQSETAHLVQRPYGLFVNRVSRGLWQLAGAHFSLDSLSDGIRDKDTQGKMCARETL